MYTDGASEARRQETRNGEERIVSILEHFGPSAAAVVSELLRDLLQFQSDDPRDDIAVHVHGRSDERHDL